MNLLAINTAFSETYVAVSNQNIKILKSMNSSLKQSENVLGLIDEALLQADVQPIDLDAIACVIGPGSFTGIRIGASIAKGFCTSNNKIKRIPINSLDLLAYSFAKTLPENEFWIVLNALSGNIFACKYNKFGKRILEPTMVFGEELLNINGIVVGLKEENLEMCNHYENLTSECLIDYAEHINILEDDSADFIPLYLRKSQAEAELDKLKAKHETT